jgi:formylglycine-generating enzyme required for sulfatase activity
VVADAVKGGCGTGGPLPPGSRPTDVSWAKVVDLGGNVREWTASDYAPYPGGKIEEDTKGKVNRGGSWVMKPGEVNTSRTRGVDKPEESRPDLGFRCAVSLGG